MNLPEYLTQDSDGYIHVTAHRIGLHDFVHFYNEGYSPEALCDTFPTLSLALVHKVIAYYLEHSQDVNAYIEECETQIERQRSNAPEGPSLAELRRRFAVRQAAGT
jgi:uncharacterized protein (DUF433 family)